MSEASQVYHAWRISYQSSEQAARAAFAEIVRLRAALATAERERDEAREALRVVVRESEQPKMLQYWPGVVENARRVLATPAPQTPSEGGTE